MFFPKIFVKQRFTLRTILLYIPPHQGEAGRLKFHIIFPYYCCVSSAVKYEGFLNTTDQPTTYNRPPTNRPTGHRPPTNRPPNKCTDQRPTGHGPVRHFRTRKNLNSYLT